MATTPESFFEYNLKCTYVVRQTEGYGGTFAPRVEVFEGDISFLCHISPIQTLSTLNH
jgi:hypothetical protein